MESRKCNRCGLTKPEAKWHKSTWTRGGTWCKQCYQEWHREHYVPSVEYDESSRACVYCKMEFKPRQRRPTMFCSRKCKDNERQSQIRIARIVGKPERKCPHCGRVMREGMRADAKFCSAECNARAHAAGRRKKVGDRDYVIARLVLHDRDEGICAICGHGVNLAVPWPNLLSASVDHVLPLSLGGGHEDANLRVVHLTCNARRRAQMG